MSFQKKSSAHYQLCFTSASCFIGRAWSWTGSVHPFFSTWLLSVLLFGFWSSRWQILGVQCTVQYHCQVNCYHRGHHEQWWCVNINLEQWWCVNIKLDISTRRERLCLYYQLIVGEVDGCDEKATPTPRVYLLLELMQVSCLVILFHSLFQWFFSLKLHKNSHYFLGRFPLSLSRKVFTLFQYVFRRHAPICPSLKVFVGGTTQTLQGTKTSSTRSRIPGVCTLIAHFHLNW